MDSFKIEVDLSGILENILVVPQKENGFINYHLSRNGVEISVLKQNGEDGWEVSGTPLNAEQLDVIGKEIRNHTG